MEEDVAIKEHMDKEVRNKQHYSETQERETKRVETKARLPLGVPDIEPFHSGYALGLPEWVSSINSAFSSQRTQPAFGRG